jgi:hypothetical protein
VRLNVAGVTPATEAVTTYPPATVLAERTVDVATPDGFVTTVSPPANVADGPDEGTTNVTVTFGTGTPLESVAVTTRGCANAELIAALWPPPDIATRFATGRWVFVNEKLAGVATPATVALTV